MPANVPDFHVALIASGFVDLEDVGEIGFELLGETCAHDPDAIDGIDDGVGRTVEDVAFDGDNFSHVYSSQELNLTSD
jgi:hypothetical protein